MIINGASDALAVLRMRGLTAAEIDELGVRVDAEGVLHVPTRGLDGGVVAVRRYRSAELGAAALTDEGAEDTRPSGRCALAGGRGRFDVTPHVARPPVGSHPELTGMGAIVADDVISAELAARRLGVPAVAPADIMLLEDAGTVAADLAGAGATVIAFRRTRLTDSSPQTGRHTSRVAAAIEEAGGRPHAFSLPAEGSLEKELAAGRRPRFHRIQSNPLKLNGRRVLAPRLARLLTDPLRAAWSHMRVRRALDLARRGGPDLFPPEAMTDTYRANLEAGVELQAMGRECGVALPAQGGFAIDALSGGCIRERKDIDLISMSGGESHIDRLIDMALGRGFELTWRVPGRFFWLVRDGVLLDIWESTARPRGRLIVSRNMRLHYPEPSIYAGISRIGSTHLDVLEPELILIIKQIQLTDVDTWFPRWELNRDQKVVNDVAALRRFIGPDVPPFRPIFDGWAAATRLVPDHGVLALSQGREFLDVHLHGKTVR